MFTSTQPKAIIRSAATLLVLLALCLPTLSAQFRSLSNPIEGTSNDGTIPFITSKLSADGNTFITSGSIRSGGIFFGWVQVYQRSGDNWIPKGQRIFDDLFPNSRDVGEAVAISDDGNTIVFSDLNDFVDTYTWDGNAWIRKGSKITWRHGDGIGYDLDLSSDGNTLVISSGSITSQPVRVYEFIGEDWEPVGAAVISNPDFLIYQSRCAISGNGESVIIGNGRGLSVVEGSQWARVMQRNNGGWEQKGQLLTGDRQDDTFGSDVAMSEDGNTIAVSTSLSEGSDECQSGYVKVFTFQNGNWVQQGNTIFESSDSDCLSSFFGYGLELSGDGSILAVGSRDYSSNGFTSNGKVSIFRYANGVWGDEVIYRGNRAGDRLGSSFSISRDGSVLAINSSMGANGEFGQAEFYQIGYQPVNDEACSPINLPVNGISQGPFSNVYAEIEPLESIIQPHPNGLRSSVWFTFRAPATGTVTATTCGSTDFDTELAIYRVVNCGDYSSYVLLGYNDDGEELCPVRTQSYLTVSDLTPGAQYFLVVDGYNQPEVDNSRGNFEITLEESLPACDNPAVAFDGVDDHVDIGPNQGNFGAGDFTFEVMVKTSQQPSTDFGHLPLVEKRDGCGCPGAYWYLHLLNNGRVQIEMMLGGCIQRNILISSTAVNDGRWHHLAFSRQGSLFILYVDGVEVSRLDAPSVRMDMTNQSNLKLGYSDCIEGGVADYFKGEMDELRVWSYARSAEEINNSRDRELAGNEEGLTAYYNFNDGKPGDDNTDRIGSIDLTGSESVARLIAFDRNGTNSNWVAGNTGIRQLDRDEDGLYDACNEPEDLPTATRFAEIPGVHLGQNYPNPTAGEVSIPIKLGGQQDAAELRFTSVMGKTVKVHPVPRGTDHDERVQVSDLPPGIYFYSLFVDNRLAGTKRMVIAR